MIVYYVTQVLKQGTCVNIKTMCPNKYRLTYSNLETQNRHLLQVYLGLILQELSLKIKSFKLKVIVIVVFKRYPSTCCLMQDSCAICSNFSDFVYLKIRITSFNPNM